MANYWLVPREIFDKEDMYGTLPSPSGKLFSIVDVSPVCICICICIRIRVQMHLHSHPCDQLCSCSKLHVCSVRVGKQQVRVWYRTYEKPTRYVFWRLALQQRLTSRR